MHVSSGVDKLCAYAYSVATTLNTPFHHMGHAKGLGNLAQIVFRARLVLHHRRTANHFQIRNFCQIRENFILHTISEERILLIRAQVFEGKDRDALCWNGGCSVSFGGDGDVVLRSSTEKDPETDRQCCGG